MAGAVARLFSADFGRSGSVNQTAGFDPRAIVPGRAGGARKRTIGPLRLALHHCSPLTTIDQILLGIAWYFWLLWPTHLSTTVH
jgi:hypothetical protein